MQPAYIGPDGYDGYEPIAVPVGYAASIIWDTTTHPIIHDTNSSPCIA